MQTTTTRSRVEGWRGGLSSVATSIWLWGYDDSVTAWAYRA
jgi:hypothetical protein